MIKPDKTWKNNKKEDNPNETYLDTSSYIF